MMTLKYDRLLLVSFLGALGMVSPARSQDITHTVEINGVAGYLEVRTSRGAALGVRITPGRKLSATSDLDDGTLTINGRIGSNARSACTVVGPPNARVEQTTINGTVYTPEDLPRIVVTGPDSLALNINGSVFRGTSGSIGAASIQQNGCSLLTLGNIAGDLELNVTGSGKTSIGAVGGKTDINIEGSGDVDVASVSDQVEINIRGAGNVYLMRGRSQLEVNINGSGSVRHGLPNSKCARTRFRHLRIALDTGHGHIS